MIAVILLCGDDDLIGALHMNAMGMVATTWRVWVHRGTRPKSQHIVEGANLVVPRVRGVPFLTCSSFDAKI